MTFVAPEGFRSVMGPEPFDHAPYVLDCSPDVLDSDPVHTRLMRHSFLNASRLATLWMDRAFADDPVAATASLRNNLEGAEVVVTHPTMASVTLPVARSLGAAVVVGHLFPMMIPTTSWAPPLGSRALRPPRPLKPATWQVVRVGTQLLLRDRAINKLRRSCGLAPLRGNAGWAWTEADATVILASPHYFGSGAPDWPAVAWGGFSIWPDPAPPLDPELSAYVEAGPPPVVVTLGTSAAAGAGEKFAHIAADLDAAGLRSILLVGHERNLASVASHPAAVAFRATHHTPATVLGSGGLRRTRWPRGGDHRRCAGRRAPSARRPELARQAHRRTWGGPASATNEGHRPNRCPRGL